MKLDPKISSGRAINVDIYFKMRRAAVLVLRINSQINIVISQKDY